MAVDGGQKRSIDRWYHNSIKFILFVRMSNQNNPYPDVNQPFINNQGQGYNAPNNQGYNPPPNYVNNYQGGTPQTNIGNNYQPPPPPPNNNYPYNPNYANQGFIPNQGGTIWSNSGQGFIPGRGLMCPICRRETDNFPRKVPGGVTWIWCFGLFIFTGICCCIPFCVDSCQDTELVCVVCQCVKARQ